MLKLNSCSLLEIVRTKQVQFSLTDDNDYSGYTMNNAPFMRLVPYCCCCVVVIIVAVVVIVCCTMYIYSANISCMYVRMRLTKP